MTKKKEITDVVKKEDVMETFDKLDESQAIAELKGNFLQEYVYSFKDKGVVVTGLSLIGVRETSREMNKRKLARIGISDKEPVVIETDDYIEVRTYAKDELNGGGYWGIKRQPKTIYKKGGGTAVNRFTIEQALAKAQRNAIRGLIPEPFVKEMIKAYVGKGYVRKVIEGEVVETIADRDNTPQSISKPNKSTKPPGEFPSNRSFWDNYDWSDKDMDSKPPVTSWNKVGGKSKPFTIEYTKLYYYGKDVISDNNELKTFQQNIVGHKEPTWKYKLGEVKQIVDALMTIEDNDGKVSKVSKEEVEGIHKDFDDYLDEQEKSPSEVRKIIKDKSKDE